MSLVRFRCLLLFSMQRYNFFESDSQLNCWKSGRVWRCLACKDTIFLKAIHNWLNLCCCALVLFSMQRYNFFESDSQRSLPVWYQRMGCLACKDTIFLKAIHNIPPILYLPTLLFSMQRYNFFRISLAAPRQIEQARLHSAGANLESDSQQ